jgi:hypothetical protein
MTVLKSGIAAGAGTITVGFSASVLMVRAASNAVISINGRSINLPTTAVNYTTIPCDYDDFTIVSGTVDYICIG